MELEKKVTELECKLEAYKMLVDKALDMAMAALVEARTYKANSYDAPSPNIEEIKKEILNDVPVSERVSPFSFRAKVDTEKQELSLNPQDPLGLSDML